MTHHWRTPERSMRVGMWRVQRPRYVWFALGVAFGLLLDLIHHWIN